MKAPSSRADQRLEQQFADANEPAIEADLTSFIRRSVRRYWIRRMSQSELAQLELDCGALLTPQAPGSTPFTAVKQLAPGVWPWTFISGPANEDARSCRDFFGAYIWDCSLEAPTAVAERAMRDFR